MVLLQSQLQPLLERKHFDSPVSSEINRTNDELTGRGQTAGLLGVSVITMTINTVTVAKVKPLTEI